MCANEAIAACAGGNPERLARYAVRMSGMLLPGAEVTTEFYRLSGEAPPGRSMYGMVAKSAGKDIIKDGRIEVWNA